MGSDICSNDKILALIERLYVDEDGLSPADVSQIKSECGDNIGIAIDALNEGRVSGFKDGFTLVTKRLSWFQNRKYFIQGNGTYRRLADTFVYDQLTNNKDHRISHPSDTEKGVILNIALDGFWPAIQLLDENQIMAICDELIGDGNERAAYRLLLACNGTPNEHFERMFFLISRLDEKCPGVFSEVSGDSGKVFLGWEVVVSIILCGDDRAEERRGNPAIY